MSNIKILDKNTLDYLYTQCKLNPYQIADSMSVNHKTVRRYLNYYGVKLRTPSEYNHLPKRTHTSPDIKDLLVSPRSVAAHIAYLCEGWHNHNASCIAFSNQNVDLITLVENCLVSDYKVARSKIRRYVKATSVGECVEILASWQNSVFCKDVRKNPILAIRTGGIYLATEFISNARIILSNINVDLVKTGAATNYATSP